MLCHQLKLKVRIRNDPIKLVLEYTIWIWRVVGGNLSLYCQGVLLLVPLSANLWRNPKPGSTWEGEPECGETSVLCPLAEAVTTGRRYGEGVLLILPAQAAAQDETHGQKLLALLLDFWKAWVVTRRWCPARGLAQCMPFSCWWPSLLSCILHFISLLSTHLVYGDHLDQFPLFLAQQIRTVLSIALCLSYRHSGFYAWAGFSLWDCLWELESLTQLTCQSLWVIMACVLSITLDFILDSHMILNIISFNFCNIPHYVLI